MLGVPKTRWWSLGAVFGLIAASLGVVLPGSVDGASAAAGSFVPLDAPQRLLDTRTGTATADGQFAGTGRQPAGSTLRLHVSGRVGVPAGADAEVLNLTAVDPTDAGFLTVFPCSAGRPNASNLNYAPSTNVANAVITKLGTNGDVCIYTFAATDLVADAAGYLPAGSYVPLGAPQRLLDTRAGAATADGQFAGTGRLAAGSTMALHVAGRVGLAAGAGVVVLNLTAVDPSDAGFLTMFLMLFITTGVGNGSTFRMIPVIFPAKEAAPVLGWTAAIAAYGSFVIPMLISWAMGRFGSPNFAFGALAVFFAVNLGVCWWFYARKGAEAPC